jgi:hypothetical protein
MEYSTKDPKNMFHMEHKNNYKKTSLFILKVLPFTTWYERILLLIKFTYREEPTMQITNMTERFNNGAHQGQTNDAKSYSSVERLHRAIDTWTKKHLGEADMNQMGEIRYLVCTTPAGRFYPVILCTRKTEWLAGYLAADGFCVVN